MPSEHNSEIDNLRRRCELHERFLKELVRGKYTPLKNYRVGGLRFGIARRWNSWYPSYFDVAGGCYVLIPGDLDLENTDNKKDDRIGVIVVDPGFGFIDILRTNYQIEPQDISAVIVTHFHPDHMAGLIEYTTVMKTSKQACSIYLNSTTFKSFQALHDSFITVNELRNGQIQEIMRYITRDKKHAGVTVKAINVHHNEIGNQHRSLGLILETRLARSRNLDEDLESKFRIGILGDTDGNNEYIPSYVDNFRDVDLLILHLGAFTNQRLGRGGKHLYIEGVKRVLKRMGEELEQDNYAQKVRSKQGNKKIVVLSEFGLEVANRDLIYRKLWPFIRSHSWRLPLIVTGLYLREQSKGAYEEGTNDNKEVSRFFARATLETIGRVCEASSRNNSGKFQETVTRGELDELLIALTFQTLAFDCEGLRNAIRELASKLIAVITNAKTEKLLDGLPLERYSHLLKKELHGNEAIAPLQSFYLDLIQKASFGQPPLLADHLVRCCDWLIERTARNMEDLGSVLYYVGKLGYISEYAQSRGLFTSSKNVEKETRRSYRWAYGKGTGIELDLFWTACLAGLLLLREALEASPSLTADSEPGEDSLLQIGAFFQKGIQDWANLIVGDIGCTFGIDPFTIPDNTKRVHGIMLKSFKGEWISPYDAECFRDAENDRISYRPSKSA